MLQQCRAYVRQYGVFHAGRRQRDAVAQLLPLKSSRRSSSSLSSLEPRRKVGRPGLPRSQSGLALTLIHLVTIPVTNTSVNPYMLVAACDGASLCRSPFRCRCDLHRSDRRRLARSGGRPRLTARRSAPILSHEAEHDGIGDPEASALAFPEEQVQALAEYVDEQLAPKPDVAAGAERVRAELRAAEARLEVKIEHARGDTIKWVAGVSFAQAAAILAVLRLFPGHP
jgi:hypothetical protein